MKAQLPRVCIQKGWFVVSGALTGVAVGGMRRGLGSVLRAKPHTHIHTLSDHSVASLESHNQHKHIRSHSHFTHSHTLQEKKKKDTPLWELVAAH